MDTEALFARVGRSMIDLETMRAEYLKLIQLFLKVKSGEVNAVDVVMSEEGGGRWSYTAPAPVAFVPATFHPSDDAAKSERESNV